jgi:hypothetical protein
MGRAKVSVGCPSIAQCMRSALTMCCCCAHASRVVRTISKVEVGLRGLVGTQNEHGFTIFTTGPYGSGTGEPVLVVAEDATQYQQWVYDIQEILQFSERTRERMDVKAAAERKAATCKAAREARVAVGLLETASDGELARRKVGLPNTASNKELAAAQDRAAVGLPKSASDQELVVAQKEKARKEAAIRAAEERAAAAARAAASSNWSAASSAAPCGGCGCGGGGGC